MDQHNNPSPSFINIGVLLLFAVVIAGASAAVTYVLLNTRTNQEYQSNQSTVIPTQPIIPSTTVPLTGTTQIVSDETANWKMYTNNVFGFRFKYPPSLTLSDNLPRNKPIQIYFAGQNLELKDSSNNMNMILIAAPTGLCCSFGLPVPEKTYDVSYTLTGGIRIFKEDNSPLEGIALEMNKGHFPGKNSIMIVPPLEVFGNEYYMWFSYNKGNSEGEIVFQQILSTFKFLK